MYVILNSPGVASAFIRVRMRAHKVHGSDVTNAVQRAPYESERGRYGNT